MASDQRESPSSVPDAASAWAHLGRPVVRPYGETWPRIDADAWIAPGAAIVGDVELGPGSSVWYGSTLRGDVNRVRIGARSNVQDHCVVHVTRDRFACEIGDEVTVGHRAVVHGCVVHDGALIGIGAIVLDGATVGVDAVLGAGAVLAPGAKVPDGMLALGVPARVVREVSPEERARQRARALDYVRLAREHARADAT
jgi:carbonic anhydrase/acetyltransferase-like protein (isoleucine patch superfamily)